MPGATSDRKTWYACSFSGCSRIFTSTGLLERHSLIHQTFAGSLKAKTNYKNKCKICPASFPTAYTLINHLYSHTGQKPFKCEFENCTGEFVQQASLNRHINHHHLQKKKYKCGFCNYAVCNKYNLAVHIRYHTGERPYSCSVCDMKFASRTALNLHFKTKGHKREMAKQSSMVLENNRQLSEPSKHKNVIVMAENLSVKIQTLSPSEISQHMSPTKISTTESTANRTTKKRLTGCARVKTSSLTKTKNSLSNQKSICKQVMRKKRTKKVVKQELREKNEDSSEEEYVRRFSCPHCEMSYSAQVILDLHMKSHVNERKQRLNQDSSFNSKLEENSSTEAATDKTEKCDNENEIIDEDVWESVSAIHSISGDEFSDNEGEEQKTANSLLAPLEIPCKILSTNEQTNADSFTTIDEKNDFYKAIVLPRGEQESEGKRSEESLKVLQSSEEVQLKCQECGKVARSYYLLYRHIQTHKEEGKMKEFKHRDENMSTNSSVSSEVQSVIDDLCNTTMSIEESGAQMDQLKEHSIIEDDGVATSESVEVKNSSQITAVVETAHPVIEVQSRIGEDDPLSRGVDKSLICGVCSKIFSCAGNVIRHMKTIHKEMYNKSQATGQLFENGNEKTEELQGAREIDVSVVPKIISPDQDKSPQEEKMKVCDLCGTTFEKMFALRFHMKKVHYGESIFNNVASTSSAQPVETLKPKPTSKSNSFKCIQCNRKLRTQFALNYHTMVMHPIKVEEVNRENDVTKITKILKEEDVKASVDEQMTVETGNMTVFAKKTNHFDTENAPVLAKRTKIMIKENGEVPKSSKHSPIFQCTECSKFCRTNMSLKRHMKNQHKKVATKLKKKRDGPSSCMLCEERFSCSYSVRRHMRIVHNIPLTLSRTKRKGGEFSCSECDSSFFHKYSLYRHMKAQHNIHFAKKSSPFLKPKLTGDKSVKSGGRRKSGNKKEKSLSLKLKQLVESLCFPCSVYIKRSTNLGL